MITQKTPHEFFRLYPSKEDIQTRVLTPKTKIDGLRPDAIFISIYLPKQTPFFNAIQRKFRLVRQLRQAENLILKNYGEDRARALMATLWQSDPMALVEQNGMAVALFLEDGFVGALHVPTDFPERVIVSDSYHIKPLLAWLQTAPQYYLIGLSAKRVQLFCGSPWDLKLVKSIEAESEESASSEPQGIVDYKEKTRRLFQLAEEQIHPLISQDRFPVVMAGVAQLHHIYRRFNRDPDLAVYSIRGNVEKWNEATLRKSAFQILERLSQMARKKAIQEVENSLVYGHGTDDLVRVAKAAVKGKVRKILVAADSVIWGKIHPISGEVTLNSDSETVAGDDVLDDLAEIVLARGGKVLCLPATDLPTNSPVAAVMTA